MASAGQFEFSVNGKEKITESIDRVIDVDDSTEVNLFSGYCNMYGHKFDVMIREGPEIKLETYNLLRNFKHNSAIPLLNFYTEPNSPSMGRFVIPRVKGSFELWIKTEGKKNLFDEKGNIRTLFKNMICDMCDVIEELHSVNIMIKNFNLKNLYMATEDTPRLLLLPAEVEHCKSKVIKGENWKSVKDVIEWCRDQARVQLSYVTTRYVGFIGSENFTVMSLKNYPQNWNYETKDEYLNSLIATTPSVIRKAVEKTDIKWPIKDGELPHLLQETVDHQRKHGSYREDAPFDYVMLIRNSYKHFDRLPQIIQVNYVTKEGFIRMVEHWTPNIWIELFDKIGWL